MVGVELHRGNGHADAEEHAGEDALRTAFAEGESQPGHDDRDERRSRSRYGESSAGMRRSPGTARSFIHRETAANRVYNPRNIQTRLIRERNTPPLQEREKRWNLPFLGVSTV